MGGNFLLTQEMYLYYTKTLPMRIRRSNCPICSTGSCI